MRPESHPSSLALDQLALRHLEGEARARAEAHVLACPRCREQVEEARAHAREFDERVLEATRGRLLERLRPSGGVVPRVRQIAASSRRRFALWLAPALAAAAMLALLFRPGPPPVVSAKGGAALTVTARHDEQTFLARDGQRLAPGDQIEFSLAGAQAAFVMVASVDGEGHASIYHPADGQASAPLAPGPRIELPDAVELDHSSGPERIFVLLSAAPLSAAQTRAALTALGQKGAGAIRRARALPLAGTVDQLSFLIEKTP